MTSAELRQFEKKVDVCIDRMGTVEKMLVDVGKSRQEVMQSVQKAFLQHPGHNVAMGWDGASTVDLLTLSMGKHQKALGCGEWITTVAEACTSKGDSYNAEKKLEKMGSKRVSKAALAEGSGATGGYTVPPQFLGQLMRLVAEKSFARDRCTVMPMQSRTLLIPALTQSATPVAGTSAFFGGIAASWQPEAPAAGYNETEPVFRQIELVARDLVFITIASNQLLQDNAVALDTLLTTLFVEAMAWFIDYYVLRGNGAAQPLGVLNAPCTYLQSGGATSTFKLVDAASMMSRLLVSSWDNACWIMHISVLPQLIQMADSTNGRLVWVNPGPIGPAEQGGGVAQKLPMTLFGIPIFFTEKLPALGTQGCVVLADLSKMLLGDRLSVQIDVSPHYKFTTNQMVWRVIARWDAQPWLDNVVVLADGTFSASPFVQLQAA